MRKRKHDPYAGNFKSKHPNYWNWIDIENYFVQLWKDVREDEKEFVDTARKRLGWTEEQMKKNSEFFLKLKR